LAAHFLARASGHRILAAVIGAHDLLYEQHQSAQRPVPALSIVCGFLSHPSLQLGQRDDLTQQRLAGLHKLCCKLLDLLAKCGRRRECAAFQPV
jgi:hypothetical protein